MSENTIFNGFDVLASHLSPLVDVNKSTDIEEDIDKDIKITEPGKDDKTSFEDNDIVDPSEITGDDDNDKGIDGNDLEDDNIDIQKDIESVKKTNKTSIEDTDLSEYESDITTYVQEKLFSKLGWDVSEEDKFESIDDLVGYLEQVVEENSQPDFASDEVAKINEFVRNGGDINKFYQDVYTPLSLKDIDLTQESNQKLLIRENLKNQGYSEERINRFVQRYEDAGTLEEEANDALELVKEYRAEKEKKLLKDQENFSRQQKEQQQKFVSDVQEYVKSIDSLRGIKISKEDKNKVLKYVFDVDASGVSQFQKDYSKSFVKNLIESAFLTMKGDAVFTSIENKAKSTAALELKKKLQQSKTKRSKVSDDENNSIFDDVLSSATKILRK
jgi:hypothetical protein